MREKLEILLWDKFSRYVFFELLQTILIFLIFGEACVCKYITVSYPSYAEQCRTVTPHPRYETNELHLSVPSVMLEKFYCGVIGDYDPY